jgi:GTP cyclohydrolase I
MVRNYIGFIKNMKIKDLPKIDRPREKLEKYGGISIMDKKRIEKAIKEILEAIGVDHKKKDLLDTPKRVAEMYEEIFAGVHKDPEEELEVVLDQKHHEIILLKGVPLYSICEHHLLPFIGKAHIAYIPKNGRVTGLSKLVRVVDILSRRPQLQERLTTQIAEIIMSKLKPMGVMVVIEAEHLCMSMRGVRKPGMLTITSAVRGIFRENQKTRSEALALMKQ